MSRKKHSAATGLLALSIMAMRGTALGSKFALTLFIAEYLGIRAVGLYGYIAGAATILPVVLGLGLMHEIGRRIVIEGLSAVTPVLTRYWTIVVALYAATTAAAAICSAHWPHFPPSSTIALLGAVLLLEHLNNDCFFVISYLKKPIFANFQVFLRAGAWIIVYIGAAFCWEGFRSLNWILLFWAGGVAVSFLAFMLGTEYRPSLAGSTSSLFDAAKKSRHIFASDTTNASGIYADRYVIGLLLGTQASGVYVIFSSLALGIYNLVNTAIMQVARPHLIQKYSTRRFDEFLGLHNTLIIRSTVSMCALSLACAIVLHFSLPFLQQPEVLAHEHVLWIVLIAACARIVSDSLGYYFYSTRRDRILLLTGLIAPLCFFALSWPLSIRLGLMGTAIASVCGYLAACAVRWLSIRSTRHSEGY